MLYSTANFEGVAETVVKFGNKYTYVEFMRMGSKLKTEEFVDAMVCCFLVGFLMKFFYLKGGQSLRMIK